MIRPEKQTENAMRNDIYQKVTDFMIKKLEQGIVPWQKPFETGLCMPMNIRKRPYRGVNVWSLLSYEHQSPFWLTFKQVKELGGNVKKGEKGAMVVFWKMLDVQKEKTEDGDPAFENITVPYLRYYYVFNLCQTENIPVKNIPQIEKPDEIEFTPIQKAEQILSAWEDKPKLKHGKHRACYISFWDAVEMPDEKFFISPEEYYCTLFHEYIHSTGHKSRTNRHAKFPNHRFGSKDYSIEELVAEMGAAFLCAIAGIESKVIDNSAAYIQSWISVFKNNKKFLMNASSHAQKACDYIAPPDFIEKEETAVA